MRRMKKTRLIDNCRGVERLVTYQCERGYAPPLMQKKIANRVNKYPFCHEWSVINFENIIIFYFFLYNE